jgi:hypothetical protein
LREPGVIDQRDACGAARDCLPAALADHVQGKVVHGAEPGGRGDARVGEGELLGAHAHRRVASAEGVGEQPGRRCLPSVEHARLRRQEGAYADRDQRRPVLPVGADGGDLRAERREGGVQVQPGCELEAGNDQDVRLPQ